jgi:hypothetical protein
MTETQETGAPFFFATEAPPTGSRSTMTSISPCDGGPRLPWQDPGKTEAVDIVPSVEYARAIIAQLSAAVIAARRNETG